MSLHADIRRERKTTIEEVLNQHTPQDVEQAARLETAEGGADYDAILKQMEWFLNLKFGDDHYDEDATDRITAVLTPEQINQFVQISRVLEDNDSYSEIGAHVFNRLISRSYAAGHTEFELDLSDLPVMEAVAMTIKAAEERPLTLKIKGKIGSESLCGAEYATIELESYDCEQMPDFAHHMRYCSVTIEGDAAGDIGNNSVDTTFTLKGYVRDLGKNWRDWTDLEYKPSHCTFKTTRPENLREMLRAIPKGNRIVYIENGTEHVMRDYDD